MSHAEDHLYKQVYSFSRLCNEGAKLTHHLSAAALCTPSRAAFLTGRYPLRSGLAMDEDTPIVIMYIAGKVGLPERETTWASYLKQNGYRTQAVGKWHLGWDKDKYGDQKHGPRGHGFDHFYGLPFTLVDGFEKSVPFFTYDKISTVSIYRTSTTISCCFNSKINSFSSRLPHKNLIKIVV